LFQVTDQQDRTCFGDELFVLEAPRVEGYGTVQEQIWAVDRGWRIRRWELLDRVAGKGWRGCIQRLFTAEHYWPERSVKVAAY